MPPNYKAFHESMAAELNALKDRFRNLVTHWGEDGHHKEAVLRAVLRRHLPESVTVGTGFIVGDGVASTQVDVLIVDRSKPTLFRDGDTMIVTPDAVRAVVEVKTNLANVSLPAALNKLAKIARLCQSPGGHRRVWTGLFGYEGGVTDHATVLRALRDSHRIEEAFVDGVALGADQFFLHWKSDVMSGGPLQAVDFWRSYEISNLAPAYFLGNLVQACSGRDEQPVQYAWFPLPGAGKEEQRRQQIAPGVGEPEMCGIGRV